jgi:hypothetical protein
MGIGEGLIITMEEIVVNLHMHTRYSDGTGDHRVITEAALQAGLDVVIVTDHNVLVDGFEAYTNKGKRRVLMLVGEEVHDQARDPQKNHMLVVGAGQEMATFADNPQTLIKAVNNSGGLTFIAHPNDLAAPTFKETAITWDEWSVDGYTGIELWNGLSELKSFIPTILHGIFFSLFPTLVAHKPQSSTLQKWDELLDQRRVVAVGGSDAHALILHLGPMRRTIYPYFLHFRSINTHIFVDETLSGEVNTDKKLVYDALAKGHCFIGYDLPSSTRGFRFSVHGDEQKGIMGDEIKLKGGVTLEAFLPSFAEIRLIKNGKVIVTGKKTQALTYVTREPGIYRIEVYRNFLGIKRGWIFSNPIYVR